jgi:predicted naringenin-chalcone synthase
MSKIISMGTAVPKYTYKQSDLSNFMATFCGLAEEDSKWLIKLNDHSEISYRHSVLPDFDSNSLSRELFEIGNNPSISERMACYFSHWQQLALSAVFQTRKSLSENNTSLEKITHLIELNEQFFSIGNDHQTTYLSQSLVSHQLCLVNALLSMTVFTIGVALTAS